MGLFGFFKHRKVAAISAEQLVITEEAQFVQDYRRVLGIVGARYLRSKYTEDIASATARKAELEAKINYVLAHYSSPHIAEVSACPTNPVAVTVMEESVEGQRHLASSLAKVSPEEEVDAINRRELVVSSLVLERSNRNDRKRNNLRLAKQARAVLIVLCETRFEDGGATNQDLWAMLNLQPISAKNNLYRTLGKLKELGYITQSGKGSPYRITDAGRYLVSHYH